VTITFIRLPTKLLEEIIAHTLLEGFESVALTFKQVHATCISFMRSHNTLRARFHNFNYYENTSNVIRTIRIAFDVIIRIAVELVVARYVRYADFAMDNKADLKSC